MADCLTKHFPVSAGRSQIVLVLGRDDSRLTKTDDIVGLDLLRRLYHRLGEVCWQRAIQYGYQGGPPEDNSKSATWIKLAREAFDQSITADERFYERIAEQVPDDAATVREPRMAISHWDRGKLLESWGDSAEALGEDFEAALILMPNLPKIAIPIEDRDLDDWSSLLDVLSWDDPVIGGRLKHESARLAVMQLSSELAATQNIATVESVQSMIDEVLAYSQHYTATGTAIADDRISGDRRRNVAGRPRCDSLHRVDYGRHDPVDPGGRVSAPLLVAIPMISIGFAVLVSTSLVALLTSWSIEGTIPGLDLHVFTTSKIFVVVILFGAGTDYCLFLIARLREEAAKSPWPIACCNALSNVMGALMGSAMTTVVGLGMLSDRAASASSTTPARSSQSVCSLGC